MPKTILVVDDEADVLEIITFRLKKLGYQVLTAFNGQEALSVMEAGKPDLIILDLIMPVMDGYELCKRLKAEEALKDMPILILTASATSDFNEKMRLTQANAYIVKPFEPQKLLEKVKDLLEIVPPA